METVSPSQARRSSSCPASGWLLHERASRLRDPKERGQRDLDPRRHHVELALFGLDEPGGGRQRSADAGPPIPHRHAVDLQLGDRDELVQLAVAGAQGGRVEGDLDLPERQHHGATPRDDFQPVGGREGRRERPVVEVRGDADAGVESPRRWPGALGEEKRVGVDGGGQRVLALRGAATMDVGQLGQREEEIRIALGRHHGLVHPVQGVLGALVEDLEEPVLEEHVARRPARIARGGGAAGELGLHHLGVGAGRSDGPRAGGQGQAQGGEQGEQTTPPHPARARGRRHSGITHWLGSDSP